MAVTFDSLPPVQHRKPSPERLVISRDGSLWRTRKAQDGPWYLIEPGETFTPLLSAHRLIADGKWTVDTVTGEIYSRRTGRPLKGQISPGGYLRVTVPFPETGRQRHVLVHIVVWTHARGPIPEGLQVDHRNGDPADNRLVNLRLLTCLLNNRASASAGRRNVGWLTPPVVGQIRVLAAQGMSFYRIAEELDLSAKKVYRITSGATYR
jgi:hypothetical protein